MDFHTFRDEYSAARKQGVLPQLWENHSGETGKPPTPVEFYQRLAKRSLDPTNLREFGESALTQHVLSGALEQWYAQGKPYVKVWPSIAEKLANTKLDVETKYLKIPYGAFEIRLPQQNNPFDGLDGGNVRALFVIHCEGTYSMRGAFGRQLSLWFDMGDHDNETIETGSHGQIINTPYQQPTFGFLHLRLQDNETLATTMNEAEEANFPYTSSGHNGYKPDIAFYRAMLSLSICTCFFMTNSHDMVCPDIPLRYADRYKRAKDAGDVKAMEGIERQARKFGLGGKTLGREIELPRPVYVPGDHSPPQSRQTWAQRFSHVRSGHLRLQAHGPKLSQRKVIFIEPTTVRGELPPRPRTGFAIKDSALGSNA